MDGEAGDLLSFRGAWRTVTLVVMALLGAATLVALMLMAGEANRQRDRALSAQAHSYDVMILARTLAGTVARAEASLGRYVIATDKALGQLYQDEWRQAGGQIDRLSQLTVDDPEQHARVRTLRRAYGARGEELALVALATNHKRNNQALARYYAAREAAALRQINGALDAIAADERRLLNRRTSAAMRSVASTNRVARILSVFGGSLVLGAITLGWLTVRAWGERAQAEADADAAEARADELAAAVRRATDELREQEAKLRQVQKMEAVGQLTGGIAHDFNNMLAVVLGGLELARRSMDAHPAVRHVDAAAEGARRAAALTRQLLAFSREEALKPEPIAPGELVAGMSDLLDRTLGDAITLVVRDEAGAWRVHADRVQLENAILNLAVNARDAMAGRGEIGIATGTARLAAGEVGGCSAGEYVTFAVRDNGCGMTPDVAERVFEPFFTTKPVGKGTGLGLSQIFAFVRGLAGEIGIATAPGRGTAVTLYLPRFGGVDAGTVAEEAAAVPDRVGALTVLVVEDDPRVLAATVGALEELGHRVIACDDPLAAPALAERHAGIDLVISDVLMPRQTGPEMVAGLLPRFPHLGVLFVTGYAGEAGGFDGHHVLRKPYTLAGMERAVATALAGRTVAALAAE